MTVKSIPAHYKVSFKLIFIKGRSLHTDGRDTSFPILQEDKTVPGDFSANSSLNEFNSLPRRHDLMPYRTAMKKSWCVILHDLFLNSLKFNFSFWSVQVQLLYQWNKHDFNKPFVCQDFILFYYLESFLFSHLFIFLSFLIYLFLCIY